MTYRKSCLLFLLFLPLPALQGQDCANPGPNLIPDGDFGAGTALVDPDTIYMAPFWYAYTLAPPLPGSAYTITNTTAPWAAQSGEGWITTLDNGPEADGYMMMLNGTSNATVFWERTLNLCGGAYYTLSLDAINLQHPDSALAPQPSIQIYANGDLSGDFGALPQDGQWHNLTKMIFIQPGVGDVLFELFNSNPGLPGNDFAVDNISLVRCGPDIEVRGNFENPLCPGDRVSFEIGVPLEFQGYWFQVQLSTDGGQAWADIGAPSDGTSFTVDGLPLNASFRVVMAPGEDELENFNCLIFSRQIDIVYQDFLECSDAVVSIGSECTGELGSNIFPNGGFGSGPDNILPFDPGYAPAYTYAFNPPPDDGTYTITNNTTPWGSFANGWIDIGDNSPDPEGYMMVVNASAAPGFFFADTVEVCENTTYAFSADIIAMNQPQFAGTLAQPNISFAIDGIPLFETGDVPVDSAWHTYEFTFTTAPGVTGLALALLNNASGGQGNIGNDLAIDNISLRPCGPELIISEAGAGPYCPGAAATFEASIGPGFGDTYLQWQYSTDGGLSWQDTGLPVTATTHTIPVILPGAQVRALASATEAGLESDNCRLVSNILALQFLDINTCFEFPVTAEGGLCGGQYGENSFPEGDFGSGPDVFGPELPAGTTNLIFQDTTWPNDGHYALMNFWDEDICEGFFPVPCWILPVTDNSGGPQGYGMVVNAAQGESGVFYTATIDGLCENTTYQFSADILNLNTRWFYPFNPNGSDTVILPNIDFILAPAGAPFELMQAVPALYNTGDILNDSTWNTYGFSFTTNPGVSSLTFALRNNAPGGGGNDFVLDNISFRMCGQAGISLVPICVDEPATVESIFDGGIFPSPGIQWQRSTDDGVTWVDVPGETGPTLLIPNPIAEDQYRYLLAASPDNLDSTFCRLTSEAATIIFLRQPTANTSGTICGGQAFQIGDSTFTQAGVYDVYFLAANGCDSIVTLDLQVLDSVQLSFSTAICQGETYSFQGDLLSDAGIYSEVFTAANGCDSTVVLDLVVNPVYEFNLNGSICEGESYFFEGQELSQAGDYEQAYQSQAGCDSIYRLSLSVLPILRDTVAGAICQGETYAFGNQALDMPGAYERTVPGSNGCDSIITLQLAVNPVFEFFLADTICEGEAYLFEGQQLSQPGDYRQQYQTAAGCDSTYNLSLAVLPLARSSITDAICEGQSYPFGTEQLSQQGIYERAVAGSNGCDSIITLQLIVHPNVTLVIDGLICQGETVFFDGRELSEAGTYQAFYQTQFGCDSTVEFSLAVLPILRDTLMAGICEGETYSFAGQSLSQAGAYEAMDMGSNGCDSITTLLLAVWPNEASMAFQSICEGESFEFGGQELTAAGMYQHVFSTVNGCDSLVTLELEVLPLATESLAASICEGETYLFGNQELTQAGAYERVVAGSNGCDSTITLELSLLPVYSRQVEAELCRGDVIAGLPVYSDTTIIFEGQTLAGCDSIVTFNVSVEDLSGFEITGARPLCSDFTVTLSAGNYAGYAWSTGSTLPDLVVSSPGWYSATVTSQRGCTAVDSVLIEDSAFTPEVNALSPLCAGENSGAIAVTDIEGGAPPYLYSFQDGPFADSSVFNGLPAGAYRLAIQDASGCEWEEAIELFDPPPVSAAITGFTDIALGDSTQLSVVSLGDSLVRFDWQPVTGLSCPDCPNPVARPGQSTTYIVTVENANGCPGVFQIEVRVEDSRKLYAPNAFSPNEDGRNDVFTVYPGKGVSRIISFRIFDRWGNKVFEGDDGGTGIPPRWDGAFQGQPMNPAVFAWYAEIEFVDGTTRAFEGEVSLIR